jgi:hypothetical protein
VQGPGFFSDGPASQMKNRFIYALLEPIRVLFNLTSLSWSFFAASHGKEPVDGVGGRAKRLVWQAILSRKTPSVLNPKDSAEVLSNSTTNLRVLLSTPASETDALELIGAIAVLSQAPKINAISTDHYWQSSTAGVIRDRLSRVKTNPLEYEYVDMDESAGGRACDVATISEPVSLMLNIAVSLFILFH